MTSKLTSGNMWNSGKKWIVGLIILGALVLFLLNNFTTQGVYDVVSCTWNENVCDGFNDTGSTLDLPWDGVCTQNIIDECCEDTIDVRMCSGDASEDPWMCDTMYCDGENEACYADSYYDDQTGEYIYTCECKDVTDWQII